MYKTCITLTKGVKFNYMPQDWDFFSFVSFASCKQYHLASTRYASVLECLFWVLYLTCHCLFFIESLIFPVICTQPRWNIALCHPFVPPSKEFMEQILGSGNSAGPLRSESSKSEYFVTSEERSRCPPLQNVINCQLTFIFPHPLMPFIYHPASVSPPFTFLLSLVYLTLPSTSPHVPSSCQGPSIPCSSPTAPLPSCAFFIPQYPLFYISCVFQEQKSVCSLKVYTCLFVVISGYCNRAHGTVRTHNAVGCRILWQCNIF